MNTESLHPFLVSAKAFCEQEDQYLGNYEPAFLARSEKNHTRTTKSGCGFKPKNKLRTKKLYEPSVLQNPFVWAIAGGSLCLTANYLTRNWKPNSIVYPGQSKRSDGGPLLHTLRDNVVGHMKRLKETAAWADSKVTLELTEDSFPKIVSKFKTNFNCQSFPSASKLEDTLLVKSILLKDFVMLDFSYNHKNGECLVKISAAREFKDYKEDIQTYFRSEKISKKLSDFLCRSKKGWKMPILEDKDEKTELKFENKGRLEKPICCVPQKWNPVDNPYPVKNPKYYEGSAFTKFFPTNQIYVFSYGCSAFYLTVDEKNNKTLEIACPDQYLRILGKKEWEKHNGVDRTLEKERKFKAEVSVKWAKSVMEKHAEVDEFDVAHQCLRVRLQEAATNQRKEAGHVDEAVVASTKASVQALGEPKNLSASDKTPQGNSADLLDETKFTDGPEAVGGASGTLSQIFSEAKSPSRNPWIPPSTDPSAQNGLEGQKLDFQRSYPDDALEKLMEEFHANGEDRELLEEENRPDVHQNDPSAQREYEFYHGSADKEIKRHQKLEVRNFNRAVERPKPESNKF